MFRQLKHRAARWRSLPGLGDGDGLCHVDIAALDNDIFAVGVAVGTVEQTPYATRFAIRCDNLWRTRSLRVEATDGRFLDIRADGLGNWTDGDGDDLPELRGCIDIDLQVSPLTNTLPIRRLNIVRASGPTELSMAYIPFDTFSPYPHRQHYTCLEDGRRYLYENADGSFSAELAVDEDGLVLDYPQLFTRLA